MIAQRSELGGQSARITFCVALLGAVLVSACSPEASRRRDGGPGGDAGNKTLVNASPVDPQPADTTLWPGRAAAPVERLSKGTMPLPAGVTSAPTPKVRP